MLVTATQFVCTKINQALLRLKSLLFGRARRGRDENPADQCRPVVRDKPTSEQGRQNLQELGVSQESPDFQQSENLRIFTRLRASLLCMEDNGDDVWLWSAAFAEVVEDLIREPLDEWAARSDWPKQRSRLIWWRGQVETSREQYRLGNPDALRVLYDYWRASALDDPTEPGRFAQETDDGENGKAQG